MKKAPRNPGPVFDLFTLGCNLYWDPWRHDYLFIHVALERLCCVLAFSPILRDGEEVKWGMGRLHQRNRTCWCCSKPEMPVLDTGDFVAVLMWRTTTLILTVVGDLLSKLVLSQWTSGHDMMDISIRFSSSCRSMPLKALTSTKRRMGKWRPGCHRWHLRWKQTNGLWFRECQQMKYCSKVLWTLWISWASCQEVTSSSIATLWLQAASTERVGRPCLQ